MVKGYVYKKLPKPKVDILSKENLLPKWKSSSNTKTRYTLKHSVYGYDPLHNQDEISSFWHKALSMVLDIRYVYMNTKNQDKYFVTRKNLFLNKNSFLKWNLLSWKQFYQECVCDMTWAIHQLSILYIFI